MLEHIFPVSYLFYLCVLKVCVCINVSHIKFISLQHSFPPSIKPICSRFREWFESLLFHSNLVFPSLALRMKIEKIISRIMKNRKKGYVNETKVVIDFLTFLFCSIYTNFIHTQYFEK